MAKKEKKAETINLAEMTAHQLFALAKQKEEAEANDKDQADTAFSACLMEAEAIIRNAAEGWEAAWTKAVEALHTAGEELAQYGPSIKEEKKTRKSSGERRPRASAEVMAERTERILKALKGTGETKAKPIGEIIAETKLDALDIRPILKKLQKEGKADMKGKLRNAAWHQK